MNQPPKRNNLTGNLHRLLLPISLIACLMFTGVAFGQQKTQSALDANALSALLSQLEDSLSQIIDDEPTVEQIVDRWSSRDDLVGKTAPQALKLLFADVQAVIADKATLDTIWKTWTGNTSPDPRGSKKALGYYLLDTRDADRSSAWSALDRQNLFLVTA